MKMVLRTVASLLAVLPIASDAQTDVVEIAPIVVTGTFELRPSPPAVDSFSRYFEKQIQAQREQQEAIARAPLWNARFWSFVPVRLESSTNLNEFFVPNYSSIAYRQDTQKIDDLRKHSLFSSPSEK
ncbi:MAG TPA: hypothetical protein VFD18_08820 [Chthoniobacterales bacterium]|nr:hypothetical protein [Chthoniobacterales bacterium]